MTHVQRQAGFLAAMKTIEQQFGLTVAAVIESEKLGDAVLTKPRLILTDVPGWQPPPETPESADNGIADS